MDSMSLIERAYALAESGKYSSVKELRTVLRREGYITLAIDMHLQGRTLRRELDALCESAQIRRSLRIREINDYDRQSDGRASKAQS